MGYRAAIFDMGDVFFDATPWRRAMTGRLREAGVSIDYARFCRLWETRLLDVYVGRGEYWAALRQLLQDLSLPPEQPREILEFARQVAQRVASPVLFDGVAETLKGLHQRQIKLGVLTDSESRAPQVRQRLAAMGVNDYFEAVVSSRDIGHVKPQPEAFAAAVSRLGVSPPVTIFVGHDAEELRGAMDFGLTAVAYNYNGEVAAHYHIRDFAELAQILLPADDEPDPVRRGFRGVSR
jgi:putative hydrolase of the HAD superfamily